MKFLLRPAVWLLIVSAAAAGISTAARWNFWWVFSIVTAAILVNGLFATLEDDWPGGLNNPDGKSTPKYGVIVGLVVRGVGVLFGALLIAMLSLYFYGSR